MLLLPEQTAWKDVTKGRKEVKERGIYAFISSALSLTFRFGRR